MAIKTQAELEQASNATYTTNGANAITAATVRTFNTDFISSSIVAPMTSSMAVGTSISASYAATASVLLGTVVSASHANNADTASYVLNAVSASRATSAANATTASYVLNAVSASYALTASYASNVPATASYAISASRATSAANADTASYVLNAVSASFAQTASSIIPAGSSADTAYSVGFLIPSDFGSLNYNVAGDNGVTLNPGTNALIASILKSTTKLEVTGSTNISGSIRLVNNGTNSLTITGSGDASLFADRRSYNVVAYNQPGLDVFSQLYSSDTATSGQYIGAIKSDFSVDVEHAVIVTSTGITLNDWDNGSTFAYVPYLTIAPNNGDNPAPQMKRGLGVTGSLSVSGAVFIDNSPLQITGEGVASGNYVAPNTILQLVGGTSTIALDMFVNTGSYDSWHVELTDGGGVKYQDVNANTFAYETWLSVPSNTGNNPAPQMPRGLGVTGSVAITEVLSLKAQNPLPSGTVGDLAVSGSHLYFYNGAWTQVI